MYHNIELHLHHGEDERGESDDGGWASILEYDEVKRAKIQPLDFWFENNKALVIITFPNF